MADARTEILIRQLQGALGGNRWLGPFTASSGSLGTGATSSTSITHNAGTNQIYVLAEPTEVSSAYDIQWIVTAKSSTTATVAFKNVGTATASVELHCFVLVRG